MHLPECHFKVAELKMHLRSLVLGAVSPRVGWEVVLGEEGGGEFGNDGGGVGGLCLLSGARRAIACADPWRFLKMGSGKVPHLEKASEDTSQWQRASSSGSLCLCW